MNSSGIKPFPIGITNFKKVIENYYFVDKSYFIAELLKRPSDITLCTRPRRFGKTLILSMLKYFFTLEKAEENRILFKDLAVAKTPCMERQGTSPVILLSLKEITGETFDQFLQIFSHKISNLYRTYAYLLESSILNEFDKAFYKKIYAREGTVADLEYSLTNLVYMLRIHHNRDVVVLIDEYDSPAIHAWENSFYKQCILFMRPFLGECLKDNENIDFAVLTGVTRISKEIIFSGLNNFNVNSILSNEFSDVFGFTENDVCTIMEYTSLTKNIQEVKEWYDGYLFGKKEIYNPWSVMMYIRNDCIPQSYWLHTSGNAILTTLPLTVTV